VLPIIVPGPVWRRNLSLRLTESHRLRELDKEVLRTVLGPTKGKVTG
jgi:hypothetical protein